MTGMENHETIRLVLDVSRMCDSPSGTLTPQGGDPVAFDGWLDLLTALRRACGETQEV
jgi:hypothetical protein